MEQTQQTIEMKSNFRINKTHIKWTIEDWDQVHQITGDIRSGKFTLKGLGAKIYFSVNLEFRPQPVFNVFIEHNQPFLNPEIKAYLFISFHNEKYSMVEKCVHTDEENKVKRVFLLPTICGRHELNIVNNSSAIFCDIKYYEQINKVNELL